MISLSLSVTTKDGTNRYAITPKVQVEFERQYKTGIGRAFQTELKAEYIYWLAWKAIHYSGQVVRPFDSWLDEVMDVQLDDTASAPLDETASSG